MCLEFLFFLKQEVLHERAIRITGDDKGTGEESKGDFIIFSNLLEKIILKVRKFEQIIFLDQRKS